MKVIIVPMQLTVYIADTASQKNILVLGDLNDPIRIEHCRDRFGFHSFFAKGIGVKSTETKATVNSPNPSVLR